MTTKDYEIIAEIIRKGVHASNRNVPARTVINMMAIALARKLSADSRAFNLDKFLRACGLSEPPE